MRLRSIIPALLAVVATPACAAPNVFWTFGFDLPRHTGRAPHFGEASRDMRYAAAEAPSLGIMEPAAVRQVNFAADQARASGAIVPLVAIR